jgi:hypothetical protein
MQEHILLLWVQVELDRQVQMPKMDKILFLMGTQQSEAAPAETMEEQGQVAVRVAEELMGGREALELQDKEIKEVTSILNVAILMEPVVVAPGPPGQTLQQQKAVLEVLEFPLTSQVLWYFMAAAVAAAGMAAVQLLMPVAMAVVAPVEIQPQWRVQQEQQTPVAEAVEEARMVYLRETAEEEGRGLLLLDMPALCLWLQEA